MSKHTTQKPEVGDTIRCERFARAHHKCGFVDGRLVCFPALTMTGLGGDHHWTLKEERDGWMRETPQILNVDAHDEGRGSAPFRVTEVRQGKPHIDRSPRRDDWPGGLFVEAQRLDKPEVISFCMTATYIGRVPEVELVQSGFTETCD